MKLLTSHELSYIRLNTYNATDTKHVGFGTKHVGFGYRIEYHSKIDQVFVETVGDSFYLFDKDFKDGWSF